MLQTPLQKNEGWENQFYIPEPKNAPGKDVYMSSIPKKDPKLAQKGLIIFVILAVVILIASGIAIWLVFSKKERGKVENLQEIELSFWGMSESNELVNEVISNFKEKHPNIKVRYEKRPVDDYNKIAENRLKSGDASVTPDVIEIEGYLANDLLDYLAPAPSEVFNPNSVENKFFPAAKKVCGRAGVVYCVPSEFNGLVLVYNKDWLDNAGIKSIPESWDDFQKMTKKLTTTKTIEEDHIEVEIVVKGGAALGTGRTSNRSSETILLLMLQNGVPLNQPEKWREMSSKNKKGAIALDFYRSFYAQKIWDERAGNSIDAFLSGRVAMIMADAQDVSTIFSSSLKNRFDWRTTMPPQISGQLNFARFKVLVVSKSSPHQKEAWEFISYYTSTETQKKIFETKAERLYKKIPPNRDLIQEISNDPKLSGFSEIFITASPALIPSYETAIDQFTKNVDEGNEKDIASSKIIETVVNAVNSSIKKYSL